MLVYDNRLTPGRNRRNRARDIGESMEITGNGEGRAEVAVASELRDLLGHAKLDFEEYGLDRLET